MRQIFVCGHSSRSYLLAVIVPTDDALGSVGGDLAAVRPLLSAALQRVAWDAGPRSYEMLPDVVVETAYIDTERSGGSKRPTFATVHRHSPVEAHASELTLEKFIDATTLAGAPHLPGPSREVRTVLLTGETGFLGRYLALQ